MVKGAGGIFYGLSLRPEFKPLKQQLIRGGNVVGEGGKLVLVFILNEMKHHNKILWSKSIMLILKDLKISRNLIFYFVMVF